MGTSPTAKSLAAKVAKLGVTIPAASVVGLAAAAKTVEVSVSVASGKYARSRLVRTGVSIRRGEFPNVMVRMVDPKAHLLDHDTKPHGRTRGSSGNPGAPNPRTHGKFMWEKGVEVARPKVVAEVDKAIGSAIAKVFGL